MFRIQSDRPISPPRDHVIEQMRQILDMMADVQKLGEAVELMAPRYPERVRAQIIAKFNDISDRVRRLQECTDGMRHPPPQLASLVQTYRALERSLDDTVAELERAQEDRVEADGFSPTRRLSDELEDRMDRGLTFGTIGRAYDGWRRRP